jgi:hypothetical protein
MKHLQSYKVFESFKEDDYQRLADTLQSEIFDDANIYFLDDDGEEEYFNNESEYPYWCVMDTILMRLLNKLPFVI